MKKWHITIILTGVLFISVLFYVALKKGNPQNGYERPQNVTEKQTDKKDMQNDGEEAHEIPMIPAAEEKIELTDYADLPIEEFMEETGIALQHRENDLWATEDEDIWVKTDQGRIVHMSISKLLYDSESGKFSIDEEWFPYTLAGISPNDNRMDLENSVLKNSSAVDDAKGHYYYSNLYLSKMGIEKLTLSASLGYGEVVHTIDVDLDMSLKENAEGLEYVWKEEVMEKSGTCNDKLTEADGSYAEVADWYNETGEVNKTGVWIKYPYLEIEGNAEMTENVNAVISEAIEKVEDRAYKSSDENVILYVDYIINYVSSKFISISFIADVTSDSKKEDFAQRCNINIAKNGEKAYLADLGFTKENIAEACSTAGVNPVNIEAYLDDFDTNWDQYDIEPMKYYLFVPALEESDGQVVVDGKNVVYVWKDGTFLSQKNEEND